MFSRGSRSRRIAAAVLPPLLFAIFVLAAWEFYVAVSGVKESTLPPPTDVAEALWNDRSMLISNAWVTIKEILLGFAAAIVLGVGLAMLIRSSRKVERAVYPWLVVSQMVPIPAIAPLLVIWTGLHQCPARLGEICAASSTSASASAIPTPRTSRGRGRPGCGRAATSSSTAARGPASTGRAATGPPAASP